ncbi:helix-turn-helix transcriptional regulator [Aequorivita sp. KMM 9714]|uniref:helix-turn-helix domain-containing protein n=1 Tax=Aequorivita sp. KMM 9714 TaxID=2707173 RepID=UPI0013EC5DA6|nr:helix-turn-helix transcriptional regulator [Aequorivita sp. KMM 9714]NGX82683.1 helix-turn-helix transcriptional regulator [Aequorivita sp. KMM 9714]
MKTIDFSLEKKKFGKHVRKLRRRLKSIDYPNRSISQQELTDKTSNLSKKTLGEIERGETNAQFESLLVLAQILEVSFSELMNYN